MNILSIVIPVYNEEKAIAGIIEQIIQKRKDICALKGISEIEILVVNDGSTDNTIKVVSQYKEVKLINLPYRVGYGLALKTGFINAQGNLIVFLDGDGTYQPDSITGLYRVLIGNDADIVVGSRFLTKTQKNIPLLRYIGNKIFASLIRVLTNKKITDATSGMRLFKSCLLPSFYRLPDGLDFSIAMTIKALYQNMKIVETVIPYYKRIGDSKLSITKDGLRFLKTLFFITALNAPFRLLLFLGFIFLSVAFFLSISPIKLYFLYRIVPDYYFYRFIFILVMLIEGLNLVLIGSLNKLLLKIKDRLSYFLFNLLGMLLILAALILNLPAIYQYITTHSITTPWIRPLTGAILILMGLQLITFHTVIGTLLRFKQRNASQ